MLHENPWMADIDVDHWRNMQTLLLDSAKERRRIVVIHEAGEIQKFVHSERQPIERPVARITDPRADAEAIYRANEAAVDFVAVFERRAFDDWTARFQDSWRSDEDLDAFVYRQYALMDEYPEYRFSCSQAQQYAWIEERHPDLFERIRVKVRGGQWIPVGGMWVEADMNLPSGESLARQIVHGQ